MRKINYSRHFIDQKDIKKVISVLKSNYLTKGDYLNLFEKKIAKFCKVKHVTALTNASCALLTCMKALNVKSGSRVWSSNNTYIASINCAMHLGAKIDLIDINLDDYNICTKNLEKKLINAKQKKKLPHILVVTHIGGFPVNLEKIFKLSKKYKFKVIEDASHAFGSKYKNTNIGDCKYSHACVFSFHPVKVITTAEGGAITTNSSQLDYKFKLLRENGTDFKKNYLKNLDSNYYNVTDLGYNFRLNEINCALGISQIDKTKKFIQNKKKLANLYFEKLDKKKFFLPRIMSESRSSWHLFILRLNLKKINKTKNAIINYLKKNKILVKTHYPPISSFSILRKKIKGKFPFTYNYYKSAISIPIYYGLNETEQRYIIKILNKI